MSQSIGNCLEIDLDEFSAREVSYSSIFKHFPDFPKIRISGNPDIRKSAKLMKFDENERHLVKISDFCAN